MSTFEPVDDAHETLTEALTDRLDADEWDGPAVDEIIGNGVTLLWDRWSDPVLTVWPDSPHYVENTQTTDLADYGETGDDIREFVDDVLADVDADRRPTDWELMDNDPDEGHNFMAFGVMQGEY